MSESDQGKDAVGLRFIFRAISAVIRQDRITRKGERKRKYIFGFVVIALAVAYSYWEEFKRGPLMDTPVTQELLVDRRHYAGESCFSNLARDHFPELQG